MIMEYIECRILRKHDYDLYKNFGLLSYKDIKENIGLGYILRVCFKYQLNQSITKI